MAYLKDKKKVGYPTQARHFAWNIHLDRVKHNKEQEQLQAKGLPYEFKTASYKLILEHLEDNKHIWEERAKQNKLIIKNKKRQVQLKLF